MNVNPYDGTLADWLQNIKEFGSYAWLHSLLATTEGCEIRKSMADSPHKRWPLYTELVRLALENDQGCIAERLLECRQWSIDKPDAYYDKVLQTCLEGETNSWPLLQWLLERPEYRTQLKDLQKIVHKLRMMNWSTNPTAALTLCLVQGARCRITGKTLLLHFAGNGDLDSVKWMLETQGAFDPVKQLQLVDNQQRGALAAALVGDHLDIFQYLSLKYDEIPARQDRSGNGQGHFASFGYPLTRSQDKSESKIVLSWTAAAILMGRHTFIDWLYRERDCPIHVLVAIGSDASAIKREYAKPEWSVSVSDVLLFLYRDVVSGGREYKWLSDLPIAPFNRVAVVIELVKKFQIPLQNNKELMNFLRVGSDEWKVLHQAIIEETSDSDQMQE